jgi:hypothetical protein
MKSESGKRTLGPWHTAGTFNPNSDRPTQWVWGPAAPGDQSGERIAENVTVANAAFIVRACNAHDELVELVEEYGRAVRYFIAADEKKGDDEGARLKAVTLKRISAAIAKATVSP